MKFLKFAVATLSAIATLGCAMALLAKNPHPPIVPRSTEREIFALMRLERGHWRRAEIARSAPRARVLVLMHGVLEDIASAYPPAAAREIMRRGRYDAVYGVTYDWSQSLATIAPRYAAALDRLAAAGARRIDLEGHSYGALQTLAGLERSHVRPRNVVLLGAPLDGTPLAERTLFSRALLRLPDAVWNDNIGEFRAMRDSGALADLRPHAPSVRRIVTRFFTSGAYRGTHVVIAYGDDGLRMGLLANVYMRVFGLECLTCATASDGVIPTRSAAGLEGVPLAVDGVGARGFSVAHADLKVDAAVIDFVARDLR